MKKYTAGFSLIELMVTLAVVAILAAIAVPSFESLMNSSARRAQLSSINGDIQFARGEALAKSRQVVVCSSSDGSTCSGNNDWSNGWIVFTDLNTDGIPDYGTGTCDITEDCLLKSKEAMNNRVNLNSAGSQLVFGPLGDLTAGANGFVLCAKDADVGVDTDHSNTLNINASGSVYATQGAATCPP